MIKTIVATIIASACLATGASAANLVQNGGFELTTNGVGGTTRGLTRPVGWTVPVNGLDFIYAPGTADTTGTPYISSTGPARFFLWGSRNGGVNVLPATSPAGGNFFAFDGDPRFRAPISQTLHGLTVGQQYSLSFYWAAAQQKGNFTQPTTESFSVTLGNQSFSTPTINNPGKGFTGWFLQTFRFTANDANPLLTFVANGTPSGQPPFALLDGVSVAVPEPSTWAMLIAGFGFVGAAARRRRMASVAA